MTTTADQDHGMLNNRNEMIGLDFIWFLLQVIVIVSVKSVDAPFENTFK